MVLGLYTHGGIVGVTKATRDRPNLAKLLCRMVADVCDHPFTSVSMNFNVPSPLHKDSFNCGLNVLVPVAVPRKGGGVWLELGPGDTIQGSIEVKAEGAKHIAGQVILLSPATPVVFDPKRRHATQPWQGGDRLTITAYSSGSYWKATSEAKHGLEAVGFRVPAAPTKTAQNDQNTTPLLKPSQRGLPSRCFEAILQPSSAGQVVQDAVHDPPRQAAPGKVRSPQRQALTAFGLLRKVLLISVFHSTVLAFQDCGWTPTRLRPVELLRSSFDDVLGRIKQAEYSAVWVDLTDARQFAGQERTSQVVSRLNVLAIWANRQAIPMVLSASRNSAWDHPAVQELVFRHHFYESYHRWCHFGVKMSSTVPASGARHKVMSTVPLPNHPCKCARTVEHIYDLDMHRGAAGTAQLRAEAERQIVASIIATLPLAADTAAGPESSTSTDSMKIPTSSTTSCQQIAGANNLSAPPPGEVALLASQGSPVSASKPPGSKQCPSQPFAAPAVSQALPAKASSVPSTKIRTCFPTDQKIQQRERAKALKEQGIDPSSTSNKRRKPIEQHYDDCGEDLSSLEMPSQINMMIDSDDPSDDDDAEAEAKVNECMPVLNAFAQ